MSPKPNHPAQAPAGENGGLWTRGFLAVNIVAFLVYCNMAMFFLLFNELTGLGLDSGTAGLVIVAFSVSVLILRPLISPFLHPGNARLWLGLGTLGVAAALTAYPLVSSGWAFLGLRVIHGAVYVLMASAAMAAFTACVPEGKSGLAFGVLGTVTLLPYAVLPPLVTALSAYSGGYFNLVARTAPVMLLALPLLTFLRPAEGGPKSQAAARPGWPEIKNNLKNPALVAILGLFLLVTTCFGVQFYFLAPFAKAREIGQAGLFFTLSTVTEISVRLFGSGLLDKFPKNRAMAAAVLLIALCFGGLAMCHDTAWLLTLALVIGLGWGVALPLFSALVFDLSPARLRAFNANLAMQAFQGGLMLGPLVGGFLGKDLAGGFIFWLCAGLCLAAALGLWFFRSGLGHPGLAKAHN